MLIYTEEKNKAVRAVPPRTHHERRSEEDEQQYVQSHSQIQDTRRTL